MKSRLVPGTGREGGKLGSIYFPLLFHLALQHYQQRMKCLCVKQIQQFIFNLLVKSVLRSYPPMLKSNFISLLEVFTLFPKEAVIPNSSLHLSNFYVPHTVMLLYVVITGHNNSVLKKLRLREME